MLDLPGHGMSSRPDAPYTLDWNAAQVARFIEHLDLRNLDLVGHSYGGGVAQWLLLKCRPGFADWRCSPPADWAGVSTHG